MAVRKPIVLIDNNLFGEMPAGDTLPPSVGGLGADASGWASGKVPVFDGTKFAPANRGISTNAATAEQLLIGTGDAETVTGSPNLTFDGSNLLIGGDVAIAGVSGAGYGTAHVNVPGYTYESSLELTSANAAGAQFVLNTGTQELKGTRNGSLTWTGSITPAGATYADGGLQVSGTMFAVADVAVVTQSTSKSTAVTANGLRFQITMSSSAIAANSTVNFTLNNNRISGTSNLVLVTHDSAGSLGSYLVTATASGSGTARIYVRNATSSSLSQAIVLKGMVIQ